MKLLFVLTALVAAVAATVDSQDTTNVGCSPKGKYCNNGTFLCCGSLKCKSNVVSAT